MNLNIYKNPKRETWESLFRRPAMNTETLFENVREILSDIRTGGDAPLQKATYKFDGVELKEQFVSEEEFDQAGDQLETSLKSAIRVAASNIKKFHELQREEVIKVDTMPGVTCWRKSVPVNSVGLYVPGGTAPLFSTVLMLGIPAVLAGCDSIVLATPPDKEGKIHPAILFAAAQTGIHRVLKAGGAQAVAAMAYGTETVPRVDKIFGPGNQYVTAAKQLVSLSGTAIDMPAGPSEVAIIADETAYPAFVAADLLSQAEHGPDSQVILFATNEELIGKIDAALTDQLEKLPRREMAMKSLSNSRFILCKSIEEAIEMSNAYAPEHLILSISNADEAAEKISNAGSVFIGHFTPESAGDYASGTNHTLPTNGAARAYSGVSLDSYMKKITFQSITPEGLGNIGDTIEKMAEAEQLVAHQRAVSIRRSQIAES